MPNDQVPAGDTRTQKMPVPTKPAAPTVETGRAMTLEVAPPHYWAVRNEDPIPANRKGKFTWAIDPSTKKAVSEAKRIDLKEGDTNATVPFDWVSDLQRDLWDLGYRSVLASKTGGLLPTRPKPDGRFDERCERAVRRLQIHARLPLRWRGQQQICAKPTYTGGVTGVVDDATKREIEVWIKHGYRRVLQPFDPEGILTKQLLAQQLCPHFHKLLVVAFTGMCDLQDLELYGPCEASQDHDVYRASHVKASWHLVGLACDMNLYSTNSESKPFYYPKLDKNGYGEVVHQYHWNRLHTIARAVGFAVQWPEGDDPRHLEYHPKLPNSPDEYAWTTPPDSIQKFINPKGGNSLEAIRKAWALAVDPAYAPSVVDIQAPSTDIALV